MSTNNIPNLRAASLKSAERPWLEVSTGSYRPLEMPDWIRLPRPGQQEPRTGLTRSVINRLCAEGNVKSITLRKPNEVRGCRLVSLPSLLEYLRRLDAEQNAFKAEGGA